MADLRAWNKYVELGRPEDYAKTANIHGMIDDLPFTYCFAESVIYGKSIIAVDLHQIDKQFDEIYSLCVELAPYSQHIAVTKLKKIAVSGWFTAGFIQLTPARLNKLKFIYEFVSSIDYELTQNNHAIVEEIMMLQGREKLRLIGRLSTLIHAFRREYFSDIPYLLNIVHSDEEKNDYYLFSDEAAMDEKETRQELRRKVNASNPGLIETLEAIQQDDDTSATTYFLVSGLKSAIAQTDATLASLREDAVAIDKKYAKQA